MIGVTRPVRREACAAVYSAGKRRAIVVQLEPPGNVIGFRLKGTRRTYYLPVEHCYRQAARIQIAAEKQQRREARAARRAAR